MRMKSANFIGCAIIGSLLLASCGSNNTTGEGVNIKLSCSPAKTVINQTAQCTGKVIDFNGDTIKKQPAIHYTSSDPTVASIDPNTGAVVAHGPGTVTLSASSPDYATRRFEFTVAWAKAQIQIFDAATAADLSGVTFTICTTQNNCSPITATESPTGTYTLVMTPQNYSLLKISKAGYQTAEYLNPQIFEDRLVVLNQTNLLPDTTSGTFNVSGHVLNALTGLPIANSTVSVKSKLNNGNGDTLMTTTTDAEGAYTFALPAGYYTLSGTADGFTSATTFFTASVDKQALGDLILNPSTQAAGAWRFILDWGLEPEDLDAHFTGPNASKSRFNVFYSHKTFSDAQTAVNLDVDDTSSYGPETITLTKSGPGLYRYSVHDFTNRGKSTSEALRKSNARVRVYEGNALMGTFYVPSGKGDVWKVFTLDLTDPNAPILLPDNRFTTIGDPAAIP